jgi:hypothetical protein
MATSNLAISVRASYDLATLPVPRRGVRLSDSGIALQVINFEQNWHRLSLYLSEGDRSIRYQGGCQKTASEFTGDLYR